MTLVRSGLSGSTDICMDPIRMEAVFQCGAVFWCIEADPFRSSHTARIRLRVLLLDRAACSPHLSRPQQRMVENRGTKEPDPIQEEWARITLGTIHGSGFPMQEQD
ncbi:hypothetical protein CHARACLAT_033603 [Characodon lateralis]|uniref:Uncharacterized protein n=1 Tax=Characodon lateralis TaxID=208331 RepID=A0ABU7CWG1_9TELE|nr:hypothetical protein [Characodon lateralis]